MFRKRNLLVAIAAFVMGVGAFAAIWGVPRLLRRSTSIDSQVTAYLLDERGNVNGLLLASGDQLRFSPETGAVVASQIKVGDQVAVNGHAGSQSSYGREVRVEQISANGQTIVEAKSGPPRRHGPDDKRGPRGRDDRSGGPGPREHPETRDEAETLPTVGGPVGSETKPIEQNPASGNDPNARQTENAAPAIPPASQPSPEIFKAASTIRTHLVNGRGDVDGLILATGEQVRFSPRVGELVVAAEKDANTQVRVEGNGVRNERGTVIRPTQITVGNQTIALGR
jgi:hypothetical protein